MIFEQANYSHELSQAVEDVRSEDAGYPVRVPQCGNPLPITVAGIFGVNLFSLDALNTGYHSEG